MDNKTIDIAGKTYKKCNVVMLAGDTAEYKKLFRWLDGSAIDKYGDFGMYNGIGVNTWKNQEVNSRITQPQHLYIVSDDAIRQGDWVFDKEENVVYRWKGSKTDIDAMFLISCRKVIATTNESLGECEACIRNKSANVVYTCSCSKLTQIPESFIRDYIKAGGKIHTVLIEYDKCNGDGMGGCCAGNCVFIKAPTGKYINVKLLKEKTYTREEVKQFCALAWDKSIEVNRNPTNYSTDYKSSFPKWIDDTLKEQ